MESFKIYNNKEIGKITIKHFFNKQIKNFPLYVKITFQRKSTQMKSLCEFKFENSVIVYTYHLPFLKAERELILYTILNEYRKGDKFSLKGIPDKVYPFKKKNAQLKKSIIQVLKQIQDY